MGRRPKNEELELRRNNVAEYFFKGYTKSQIKEKLGCTDAELNADLKLIKRQLSPKTIKALEYRKNKSLSSLNYVKKRAWELVEGARNDGHKLGALRIVISAEELVAKVEGTIQEQIKVGPDKESAKLLKELRDIEAKAQGVDVKKKEDTPDDTEAKD